MPRLVLISQVEYSSSLLGRDSPVKFRYSVFIAQPLSAGIEFMNKRLKILASQYFTVLYISRQSGSVILAFYDSSSSAALRLSDSYSNQAT
ncbi:hypothetical protein ACFQE2_05285 [Methylophaga thalassica]|uniref:hypothetical protein n=1 Tax=Methylophaga thalassica TaxID=40223 RepID=UPI002548C64F|nr:hypothetical protein [Methylophaga thalassica]